MALGASGPTLIQKCKDSGYVSIVITDPGKRVRLEFKIYRLPDNVLTITVNLADNTLTELIVSSGIGKEKDTVSLDVTFGKIKDMITYYPSRTVLAAKAKNLTVLVTNSGQVKMNRRYSQWMSISARRLRPARIRTECKPFPARDGTSSCEFTTRSNHGSTRLGNRERSSR